MNRASGLQLPEGMGRSVPDARPEKGEGRGDNEHSAYRLGYYGAVTAFLGVLLSGPLASLVVESTHPQPPWAGATLFVHSYHPVQLLPYVGEILRVSGFVLVMASLHAVALPAQRGRTTAVVMFSAVFASFVLLNDLLQTTFVPALVHGGDSQHGPLLDAFSAANPEGLSWGLAMWGNAALGVASWLVAPVFADGTAERLACFAFIANAPMTILPAAWTTLAPGWTETSFGFAVFGLQNVLAMLMTALAAAVFRGELRRSAPEIGGDQLEART